MVVADGAGVKEGRAFAIGARTPEQLAQNLASADLVLDADERSQLDGVSALAPWYPGWMVERQTADRR